MSRLSRRGWFVRTGNRCVSAICGSAVLTGVCRQAVALRPPESAGAATPRVRTSKALGATARITVLANDSASADMALDAAMAELQRVDGMLSIYRTDSLVSELNCRRVLKDADREFIRVLQIALEYSRRTDGAFDITVQPLWNVYESARRQGRLPTQGEIDSAKQHIGWRQVQIDGRRVELNGAGTAITLNALAQGYALDRVLRVLGDHGIHDALVDTGELGAIGHGAQGQPWKIGIQHPRHADAYVAVVALDGRCLATSGDYATVFSSDQQANHLFVPQTGRSPGELASVSVVAPRGIDADALATAVSIMGTERGLKLIAQLQQVDALVVDKSGHSVKTRGFPAR